jgi:4,5:9,10-diseco-3-hydroxy-5,9,17-trioxoandrosta-1(10),2-diene-4-oate hydrolase
MSDLPSKTKGGLMTLPKYDDHYVKVGGKDIRYWVGGQGPAVILVHGLSASAEYWQYNLAPLSEGYRVYAPDLLGFGRSDKGLGQFSLLYGASFIADFMDALEIERATLAGNSMGGVVCAQFAVQFPPRLEKLILVGSAGFGGDLHPVFRSWSIPIVGNVMFSLYQRAFPLATRWNFCDPGSIDREWIDGAAAMLRMPKVKESSLRIVRVGVDLRGQREELLRDLHRRLPHMTAPTLIIWGSHDPAVPVSHAHAAQKLIPNSQVRIMDRCGHTPQVERPQEFNQLVLDFLREGD